MNELARTDIRRYLNVRSAYWPTFAADGQSLAFLTDITGTPQVWSVPVAGGWPEQVTFYSEAVHEVDHHPHEEVLVFAMDRGGNERTQLFLSTPEGSEVTALTSQPEAIHTWGNWSNSGSMFSFSANREDSRRFDVYVQSWAHAGEPARLLRRGPGGYYMAGSFSPDDRFLVVTEAPSSACQFLHIVDVQTGEDRLLTTHNTEVRYQRPRWSSDGRSLFALTDLEGDFLSLAEIELDGGSVRFVERPDWDVEAFELSHDGRWLAWVVNEGGPSRLYVRPLDAQSETRTAQLPLGVIAHPRFSPDDSLLAFTLTGPRHNMDVWVYDVRSDATQQVTRSSRAGIPDEAFVQPELVRYQSFDGLTIPAWLYLPPDVPPEARVKPPVIVYPHGGPEAQTRPTFDALFAYLLNRAYAIFAPNVRGSSGYGRRFMDMDNRRKRMDSVKDLAHGAFWLRDSGKIDPTRMAICGGSYGGFMVLAAVTNYPDLYAAAVDVVGIANWTTFLERTGAYRLAHREAEYGNLREDRDFLDSISPIRAVDKIRTPMMVIHGANDPRVPVEEAEQIVAALRRRSVPVEYLRYEDEGHGLVKLPNRLDAYPRVASFLDQHLGR